MNEEYPALAQYQSRALIVGAVASALCVLAALAGGVLTDFYRVWLVAFNVFTGVAVGSLVVLMLQYLTGGDWGFVLRRPLEAATRTLPLLALLFLPLVPGLASLYIWVEPEKFKDSPVLYNSLLAKAPYLNVGFFLARTAAYFAIWILFSQLLSRWSREQDATQSRAALERCETLSAPGMVLYVLTVTFASIDWVMSLEPEWYSTIYGAMYGMGQVLSGFSFAIVILLLLGDRSPVSQVLTQQTMRDLGSLLLAFVMVWAYLSLMQFLLIWSGNLPEEVPWYLKRLENGWSWVALSLIFFGFALPFMLLLSTDIKKRRVWLLRVALLICLMRIVDLVWLIVPGYPGSETSSLLAPGIYVLALVGFGGLWLAFYLYQLRQMPLVAVVIPPKEEVAHA